MGGPALQEVTCPCPHPPGTTLSTSHSPLWASCQVLRVAKVGVLGAFGPLRLPSELVLACLSQDLQMEPSLGLVNPGPLLSQPL